jgi:hypothetical protein
MKKFFFARWKKHTKPQTYYESPQKKSMKKQRSPKPTNPSRTLKHGAKRKRRLKLSSYSSSLCQAGQRRRGSALAQSSMRVASLLHKSFLLCDPCGCFIFSFFAILLQFYFLQFTVSFGRLGTTLFFSYINDAVLITALLLLFFFFFSKPPF